MGDVRVSQLIAETVVQPTPSVRVSQAIIETVLRPTPDVRVSQIVIEVIAPSNAVTISAPSIAGTGTVVGPAITGSGSETAGPDQIDGSGTAAAPSSAGSGDVTIGPDQIAGAGVSTGGDARVSQGVAEVFGSATADARVTAALAEAFGSKPGIAMVTETVIEVFGLPAPSIPLPVGGGEVAAAVDPTPDDSMCGSLVPLFYCEIQTPDGVKSYSWTDQPINEAAIQRLPRIVDLKTLRREASDWTGAPVINGGTLSVIDHDGSLRALHVAGKLTRSQIDFYLIDDDGRRLGDLPMRAGQGLLTGAKTSGHVVDLAFDGRIGGKAARVVLNKPVPFRRFTPAFNAALPAALADKVQPLPYGLLLDETAGFPTVHVHYSGTRLMPDGNQWYEGYIAGCATYGPVSVWGADGSLDADGKLRQVKLGFGAFSTDVAICNSGAGTLWDGWFGTAKYLVYDGMRHSVMYLKVGSVVGEAFRAFAEGKPVGPPSDGTTSWGAVPVHVNMGGIDEKGDGTLRIVTSIPRQLQHLTTNFVQQNHNTDADWYPIPTTDNATPYSIIDTASVEAVVARMEMREPGHYQGAFVIGHDLEPSTYATWLQRLCLAGDFQVAEDRHGRLKLGIENPDAPPVKDFTVTRVLKGTYKNFNDDAKRANAVTVKVWKNYMLTNAACQLRDSSKPQPAEFLSAPRPFSDGPSIAAHGGEPTGREEFVFEDWITRDLDLKTPDNVASYVQTRRTNGVDMHVLETDLCGYDVDVFDNFTITHDEGMVSTTRVVRCMAIELDPPNPHRKTWAVRLFGYDVTDLS